MMLMFFEPVRDNLQNVLDNLRRKVLNDLLMCLSCTVLVFFAVPWFAVRVVRHLSQNGYGCM